MANCIRKILEKNGRTVPRYVHYVEKKDDFEDAKNLAKPIHFQLGSVELFRRYRECENLALNVPQTELRHNPFPTTKEDTTYYSWNPEEFLKWHIYDAAATYWKIIAYEVLREERKKGLTDKCQEFSHKDIAVTDPCYILKDDIDEFDKLDCFIFQNTVYGDWSCTLFDYDTKKPVGEFCADGANVCVCDANAWYIEKKPTKVQGTVIKDFTGFAYIKYSQEHNDYYVEIVGTSNGQNIHYISAQTGF